MRHAMRRRLPWQSFCLNCGTCLCLVGGIVFVSTPVLGAWVFGIGAVMLIAATA